MKNFKLLFCIIWCFTLLACSNTSHYGKFEDKFASNDVYVSDYQRMLSLTNRPMPSDQVMMIAFEQQRANESGFPFVQAVQIRGSKQDDPIVRSEKLQNTFYTSYVVNDANAISLVGPR